VNVSGCAVKDSDVHAGVHVRERPVRAAEKVTVSGGLVKASMQAVDRCHVHAGVHVRARPVRAAEKVTVSGGPVKDSVQAD